MNVKNQSKIVFTFASAEVNLLSQQFIKIIELLTGKLLLKKLYDEYLIEKNIPQNFWKDAIKKVLRETVNYKCAKFGSVL